MCSGTRVMSYHSLKAIRLTEVKIHWQSGLSRCEYFSCRYTTMSRGQRRNRRLIDQRASWSQCNATILFKEEEFQTKVFGSQLLWNIADETVENRVAKVTYTIGPWNSPWRQLTVSFLFNCYRKNCVCHFKEQKMVYWVKNKLQIWPRLQDLWTVKF